MPAIFTFHNNSHPLVVEEILFLTESLDVFLNKNDLLINNLVYVRLDGAELSHAINNLGAVNIKSAVVTYFGDEAKRILANWNCK